MHKKNNNINTLAVLFSFFFFSQAVIFQSCTGEGIGTNVNLEKNIYFNLKEFLDLEKERLSSVSPFSKTVFVNGEKEQKEIKYLDFEKELKPFYDSDINRPAWSDKYKIDSVFQKGNQLHSLVYVATDEKLKTRRLSIDFKDNEVVLIDINNASKSSVANTFQVLTYDPTSGFTIESTQDVSFMDENKFRIEIKF